MRLSSSTTSSLGVTLKLSPEALGSLQYRRQIPEEHELHETAPFSSEDEGDLPDQLSTTESDDWDDVIATQPPHETHERSEVDRVSGREEDAKSEQSEEDDLSLGPPPSLPVVVVDLERLVGYVPACTDEAEQLRFQVTDALCRDEDDDRGEADVSWDSQQDCLSRHFEDRVTELFDVGVAFHGNTLERWKEEQPNRYVIAPYPEFLCRVDRQEVVVTSQQWKRLLRSHPISVVDRVLQHLAACSRPMSWKVDMHQEIWRLSRSEDLNRADRKRLRDLTEWRTHGRKEQLDKLYQVRETFDQRLEMARMKLSKLEDERDEAVIRELRRLRMQDGHTGGREALDFDSTVFAFSSTGDVFALSTNVNDFDIDVGHDSSYEGEDDAEDSKEVVQTAFATPSSNEQMDVNESDRAKARRQAAARKHRRKLASQAEAAKIALEQEKVDQALAEEERVTESVTSPKIRKLQAVVQSLEDRLAHVDDLLESLQDEEWADDEEGILRVQGEEQVEEGDEDAESSNDMSLLDQILAMIFGMLPPRLGEDTKRHYEYVREEHIDITRQWKEHFGRLPPSFSPEEMASHSELEDMSVPHAETVESKSPSSEERGVELTVSEMRQAMNIVDNDVDDWEDAEIADSSIPSASTAGSPIQHPGATTSGLRPGGQL